MASVLAEICIGAEEHIPERSPAVNQYQGSSDKTARSSCASDTSTTRHMQLQASDTTSEENNDDMAPDAADADADADADAASSDKVSVDDNVARTEKYLRLIHWQNQAQLGQLRRNSTW